MWYESWPLIHYDCFALPQALSPLKGKLRLHAKQVGTGGHIPPSPCPCWCLTHKGSPSAWIATSNLLSPSGLDHLIGFDHLIGLDHLTGLDHMFVSHLDHLQDPQYGVFWCALVHPPRSVANFAIAAIFVGTLKWPMVSFLTPFSVYFLWIFV